jgi:hypothetical protein
MKANICALESVEEATKSQLSALSNKILTKVKLLPP